MANIRQLLRLQQRLQRSNSQSSTTSADTGNISTKEALSNNLYILKMAWRIHPRRVVGEFVRDAIEQFLSVFFSIVFIKYFLESIESGASYQSLALFILASAGLMMAASLIGQWYEYRFIPISDTIIHEKLYEMLFRKASEVELNCYEDADFYNRYTLAIKEADTRMQAVVRNVSSILFSVIAIIVVFAALFAIDRYIVLFALFPIIG